MRILAVGDTYGVPQTLRAVPRDAVVGIVAAANRPQHHAPLAALAAERNAPLMIQPAWRSAEYSPFVTALSQLRPDLIVSNSYSMLIRPDVLAIPRLGGINLHFGRLPEFRGPNPLQWAIIEDERSTAATLHWMSAEIDAGDIIAEAVVEIGPDDRWRDVWTRLDVAAEQLLPAAVRHILAGTAERRAQNQTRARTRRRRTPDDSRIDWDAGVRAVYNLIRALGDGLPPAFYETDDGRVELDRRVTLAEATELSFAPGPGQRRFSTAGVSLIPVGDASLRFQVLGSEATIAGLELAADGRAASIWTDPADGATEAALTLFAETELRLRVR